MSRPLPASLSLTCLFLGQPTQGVAVGFMSVANCAVRDSNKPMRLALPPREQIEPNTPLRLSVAAALAFPDGSMTASGLRRECSRGRLVIERIAGKDYTTLANIERMRELCRVEARVPGCGFGQRVEKVAESSDMRSGSSSMAPNTSPQGALRMKLAKRKSG